MRTKLFKLLNGEIINSDVYKMALTHRSAGRKNNERLEFLGDSVLNLVITEYLYAHLANADEGSMSRFRSHLVRGETLAEIASENNLGEVLKLGPGELKSGGFRRKSIIEDALEAIIGAVYELKGFEYTRNFVLELFAQKLENLPDENSLKDPKSRLQEWLQSNGHPVPEYEVLETSGKAHQMTFLAECRIPSHDIVSQEGGSSRRKAEQGAAKKALDILQKQNIDV